MSTFCLPPIICSVAFPVYLAFKVGHSKKEFSVKEKKLMDKVAEIKESNLKEVGIEREMATLRKEIAVHFEKVKRLFEESDNTTTSTL